MQPETASARPAAGPPPTAVFGALWQLRADPLAFFTRIAGTHGDVVRVRLGIDDLWVLSNPADVEQMLIASHDRYVKDRVTRAMAPVLGQGLLTSDGDGWRRHRKLCAPSFQPRQIAGYGATMVDAALRHLPADGPRDLHADITALTLDIVLRTLFGSTGDDAGLDRVGPALAALMTSFEREQRTVWRFVPKWVPGAHRRRAWKKIDELHALVLGIVAERRRRPPGDDLLWRLLEARDEDGTGMDDVQVRDEAMTLFLAGHETTALALSYAVWQLAAHPELQDRARAEAEALGREPTAQDLGALPFVGAVVKETLRLYPPAWAFGREPTAPVTVGGATIPAGTHVIALPWVIHRDPRWWREPAAFRPDRWLGDELRDQPRLAYVPFGAGPRVCIGNHFATMEIVLVLATWLRHRRFRPVIGFAPTLVPAVTLRPRDGVWVDCGA
ncbi:MAG: cytochrome P450 [Myxococcota bacterium]